MLGRKVNHPLGSTASLRYSVSHVHSRSFEPTFVANSFRQFSSDTDSDDVGRRKDQVRASLSNVAVGFIDDVDNFIQGHSRDHRVVLDFRAIRHVSNFVLALDGDYAGVELESVCWQSLCDRFPDTACTVLCRESESGIRAPKAGVSVLSDFRRGCSLPVACDGLVQDILDNELERRSGDSLAKPLALHLCDQ